MTCDDACELALKDEPVALEHCRECPQCREHLDAVEGVRRALAQNLEEPPEKVWERLAVEVRCRVAACDPGTDGATNAFASRTDGARGTGHGWRPRTRVWRWVPVGVAAASLALGGSLWLFQAAEPKAPPAIAPARAVTDSELLQMDRRLDALKRELESF